MSANACFDFDVAGAPSSATLYGGPSARAALVLAHGAGGRQSHPWMVAMARAIVSRGLCVVTFDFPYAHAGRRLPDRNDVLEASWRQVMAMVRARDDVSQGRLFIGGKSMGGRIATQVAASGSEGDLSGLVLLGYPLHPPGRPQPLRAAHLAEVKVPMLFVQGSRDVFGTPDELRPIVQALPSRSRLFVVDGADHSLVVPKRGGATLHQIMERVADEVASFALAPPPAA